MKMKIFILLVIGTLIVSHYKNITAAKASPALDEDTQETTTIGEPRKAETSEASETAEKEQTEPEQTEPEQNKPTKKTKKAAVAADEDAEEEQPEEAPATEQKERKVFSRDEIGAILLCILFCVALICGYLVMHIFFKRG